MKLFNLYRILCHHLVAAAFAEMDEGQSARDLLATSRTPAGGEVARPLADACAIG
ncbi:MAG: hypothetical protein AB1634_18790 [Thermodesulfobacteriota bacterium]